MGPRTLGAVIGICAISHSLACASGRPGIGSVPGARHGTVVDVMWRGDRSRVTALLREGVDVNRRGPHGQSALEGAAWHGDEQAVVALLGAGAFVGPPNERALQFAAVNGHAAVVRRLLAAGADPDVRDDGARSPLSLAALGGHLSVVEAQLDFRTGMTALMLAAAQGHADIVRVLVERGANIAARCDDGGTAWTMAVERNDRRMMALLQAGVRPRRAPRDEAGF